MEGDKRIDELMRSVHAAINRHVKNSDAKTDIYNRAYEALMNSMAEIKLLQSELKAANEDATRLASELEETYVHNDICWEEPGESSPALIAHKLREEKHA